MQKIHQQQRGSGNEDQLVKEMLNLCAKREYSTRQIQQKLQKKEVTPSMQQAVIARLYKARAIDDKRYAAEYIRSGIQKGTDGPKKIIQKLRERGIQQEVIEHQMSELYSEEQQRNILKKQGEKYQRSSPKTYDQLRRFLLNRGFESHDIQEYLQTIQTSGDSEDELW